MRVSRGYLGEQRDINTKLDHTEVRKVKVGDKVVVIVQTVGRSISRKVVNGRAAPQTTYLIYPNSEREDVSAGLLPYFPKAKWEGYRTRFAVVHEGIVETWAGKVAEYLRETDESISSRKLKQTVGAMVLASVTWKRVVRLALTQVPYYAMIGQTAKPIFNTQRAQTGS